MTNPADIDSRWKEYFSELLNVNEDEEDDLWEPGELRNGWSEITPNEVETVLKRMKMGKAAGCDGLLTEIFKETGGH